MKSLPLPGVLRSWQHLRETDPSLVSPKKLPIQPSGTTYVMTQELAWVDLQHFAVGRWDGSMSVFRFTESVTQGPLITEAVNTPSAEDVQMITWLAPGVFASSNDEQSVIVWKSQSCQWNDLARTQMLSFDSSLGVANSGTSYVTPDASALYLLVGHANGYVTIWRGAPDGTGLGLTKTVDVRSSHPVNPWGIHNVRGVSLILWSNESGYAVTGSEDGDLCVLRVPDGAILSRTVYNPLAQRGINSTATLGQNLLVANCSVGLDDKNLWYYWIDSNDWSVQVRDSASLQVNSSLAQVFNFDVIWGYYSDGICWFSATEEGILWMGTLQGNSLSIIANQQVTAQLGAALGMSVNGAFVVAAYNLYEFDTTPGDRLLVDQHPEHFAPPA